MARNPRFEMYSTRSDGSNFPTSSTASHGENLPLSWDLLWDKQSMGDQTYHCYPKPKRVTNAAVGTVAEYPSLDPLQARPLSSPGVEELKQAGSCITENDPKTKREWLNIFNEPPYELDRYHRSILPRNRSQIEPSAAVSNTQVHIRNESAEVEWCPNNMPKSSELISREGYIPMSEIHSHNMPKQSRYMSSFGEHVSLIKDDDQTLFAGKAKMTGRCSGIMSDVSVEAVAKTIDGDRNYKQVVQQRSSTESHSRPSECHGFRSNISNGRASQPSRLKTETISSLAHFSEIKESGAGNKHKKKIKKIGDADAKIAQESQDFGDGVRREGSSGRASSLHRMNALENPATTKQPRSTKLGNDKVARKTFRQFVKKILLDKKPITSQRCLMNSGLPDFTDVACSGPLPELVETYFTSLACDNPDIFKHPVGVLDDREEHPAAVNVCNNASDVGCSGPLPELLMEPYFTSLACDNLDIFKHPAGVLDDREEHPAAVNVSNNASDVGCSGTLPELLMEPYFTSLARDNLDIFKHPAGVLDDTEEHPAAVNVSNNASGPLSELLMEPNFTSLACDNPDIFKQPVGVLDDREEHPAAVNVSNNASGVSHQ